MRIIPWDSFEIDTPLTTESLCAKLRENTESVAFLPGQTLNWSFMLPAATVTNAMVYGTGEVTIRRMMREGCVLNLIGAVLVSTVCYLTLR